MLVSGQAKVRSLESGPRPPTWVAETQTLGPSSPAVFSCMGAESQIKMKQLGLKPVPTMESHVAGSSLTCCITRPVPKFFAVLSNQICGTGYSIPSYYPLLKPRRKQQFTFTCKIKHQYAYLKALNYNLIFTLSFHIKANEILWIRLLADKFPNDGECLPTNSQAILCDHMKKHYT